MRAPGVARETRLPPATICNRYAVVHSMRVATAVAHPVDVMFPSVSKNSTAASLVVWISAQQLYRIAGLNLSLLQHSKIEPATAALQKLPDDVGASR